jgi:dual specificity tyrosine-phosphorylation-regulated kinase 2/3/4
MSRHSVESGAEKDALNSSMITINPISKLNESLTRPGHHSNHLTPNSQSSYSSISDTLKVFEETRPSRLNKRNSVTRERNSINDPDLLMSSSNLPLKPAAVFKLFVGYLSKYEQAEVLDYQEIYFLGMNAQKVKTDHCLDNFGFDDERSDYKLVVGDHVAYRYEIQQVLGKGSFGQVCKCFDHKMKKHVAIKMIRNQKRFHRQAKVEIKVLQELKDEMNQKESYSVQMLNYFVFRRHICITFELLSRNLYDLLKSNNFRGLSLSLVRRFIAQILTCLQYLKEKKIIHCDLKPENILLTEFNKSGIKVIDFGSSCLDTEKIYTYIQSRFYRAPEIILGIEYTCAIDMWSLGCIAAELHSGYPLFPGESEAEQLLCIMEIQGIPPDDILMAATRKKLFFDGNNPKILPNSRGKKRIPGSRKIEEKVKSNDEIFLDFIKRCLEWNPANRITPDQAFEHEFIQEGIRNYHRNVNTAASTRSNTSY